MSWHVVTPAAMLQDKMAALLVANTLLWPTARFLNDKFVPQDHRVTANHIMPVSHCALLSAPE